jgi:tetratricopeptide (TPR) repeat protein
MIAYAYPTTEQGIDARVRLGLTQEALRDTASEWIQSADSFRATKKYADALKKYAAVAAMYPNTRYAPRAIYAQGYVYERDLKNLDSAIRYYRLLTEKYPDSPFSTDIKPSLDAALEQRRLQDSLAMMRLKSTTASVSATSTAVATTSATLTNSTNATPGSPQRRRQ